MPNRVIDTVETTKGTLALLLGADRGRITGLPTRKVEITRLSEALGEPVIFTIRAVTQQEYADAQDMAAKINKKSGEVEEADTVAFQRHLLQTAILDPDLGDPELRKAFDAPTPSALLAVDGFLLAGEQVSLYNAIAEISGFGSDAVKTVKN